MIIKENVSDDQKDVKHKEGIVFRVSSKYESFFKKTGFVILKQFPFSPNEETKKSDYEVMNYVLKSN